LGLTWVKALGRSYLYTQTVWREGQQFRKGDPVMATTAVPIKPSAPVASVDIRHLFHSEMNWLFDVFTRRFGVPPFFPIRLDPSLSRSSPAAAITEKDDAFVLSAEMPGMAEQDIRVSLSEDMLTIAGEKRRSRKERAENRYLSERNDSGFQRVFSLPDDVDRETIAASFDNGVLTVTLPKSAKAAPRKIEIKATA
jgi:HSP20 family protein